VKDVRPSAQSVVELETAPDQEALKRAFIKRGVWVRPFGKIVYLTPALNIDRPSLDTLTTAVCEVISALGGAPR